MRVTKKKNDRTVFLDPVFRVRQRLTISEPGLHPWLGVVRTIKPSSESGWWYEIHNEDNLTWVFQEDYLKEVAS